MWQSIFHHHPRGVSAVTPRSRREGSSSDASYDGLTENLSVHAKKAHGNRSKYTPTMLMHDVTTAYAAEKPAKAFRVVSKD